MEFSDKTIHMEVFVCYIIGYEHIIDPIGLLRDSLSKHVNG